MKVLPFSPKPIKTIQFFQDHGHSPHLCDPGATEDRGLWRGRLRSNDVTTRFSPISLDRMEIETRKNGAKRLGSSSRLGKCAYWPTLAMVWLWPDLDLTTSEVKISNWPSKVKSRYMFRTGLTKQIRWCLLHFRISHIKKLLKKNHLRGKNNFSFDDLWSRNSWPYVKSDQKTLTRHEESSPIFSLEFFLAITLLEIIEIACEKRYFLIFDLRWPHW